MDNLKRTKASSVKLLYQLMYDVHRILSANDIKYWTDGGTTLGVIRNRGIIPWDDDLDIGIMKSDLKKFLKLKAQFKKCGYAITKTWFGYKIYIEKRKKIKGYDYSYPFLDVFPYKVDGKRIIPAIKDVLEEWPKGWYKKSNLDHLQLLPFGDFQVYVSQNPEKYCDRLYGKDWKTHGYREYDHATEEEVVKKKVKLTKRDLEPARPTKVAMRRCIEIAAKNNRTKPARKNGDLKSQVGIRKAKKGCDVKSSKGCASKIAGKSTASFVINCDVHKKRIKKFRRYANEGGLKSCREVCVNGRALTDSLLCDMIDHKLLSPKADVNPIEVSIFLSHFNVWQRFVDSCKDYALVFEDDVEVRKDFKSMLSKTLLALEKAGETFDILFLWNGNWADSEGGLEEVLRVDKKINILRETEEFNAGAVSYVLSAKFAKKLLKKAYPITTQVDIYIGELAMKLNSKVLTVEQTHNNRLDCYLSPFFRGTKWVCGGPEGTGDTTQDYDAKTVNKLKCKKKKKSRKTKADKAQAAGKCANKSCRSDQICNPSTGRCVLRRGKIGKKLLGK